MIARILALVLALLLVGGGVAAWAAPVDAPDPIVQLADEVAVALPPPPAIPPSPHTISALPDAPAASAGRAHVDAVFRPPRLLTSR